MSIKNSRVVITGGAGLIGSHISQQCLSRGASEVIVLDDFSRGTNENLKFAEGDSRLKVVRGSICDRELVLSTLKDADYLFHQAAIRITRCAEEPRVAMDVLAMGSYNVFEAAVETGVKKVVAASTASVYGLAELFPTEETHHSYNNRTLYGAAKAFNEGILRSFNDMYDLNYVALRYFNVYGPRMDIFGVYTEVLIRWMERIERGEAPLIFGDGTQTMDFVFVEDIARANILAAESPISDEVFNVASGEETSLLDLANLLMEVMGTKLEPEFREARKVNPVSRRLACTKKASSQLGFKAEVSLKEGLERLVSWWREARKSETLNS